MTVRIYIGRDPQSGVENPFEHTFERRASIQIARLMWSSYQRSSLHYSVLVNLAHPPIDMLIITNDGLGLIELKDYSSPVAGTESRPWHLLDERGRPAEAVKSGSKHINPFDQVRTYRNKMLRVLKASAERLDVLPRWFTKGEKGDFRLQAAVVFTGVKFNMSRIKIHPRAGRPWFSMMYPEDVDEWAQSLSFGSSSHGNIKYRLTDEQIACLAQQVFSMTEWTEINGLLAAAESLESSGYLWLVVDERETHAFPLDRDEILIGRLPENAIVLSQDIYPSVSRTHAKLRRVGQDIMISDCGSRHGTWLNHMRLMTGQEVPLAPGDRVVLGTCDANGHALTGACTLIFRAELPMTDATIGITPLGPELLE